MKRRDAPNQTLERTAARRVFTSKMIKIVSAGAQLAIDGGRSALFSLDLMRLVAAAELAAMLLAVSAPAKEQPVVSVSSEPTGLTVKSQKSGKKIIPGIDIYSDGRVIVRRYDGSEATKQVDRAAVEALLQSLDRARFYKITEDSFNAEVNSSHRPGEMERIVVTDCPIWTIRSRHAGVTRSTKFYGLWEMAEYYPNIKQLRTLKDAILMVYSAVGEKPF